MAFKPRNRGSQVEFVDFIHIPLAEEDVQKLLATKITLDDLMKEVIDLANSSYKFTVSTNDEGTSAKAALMDISQSRKSAGYMLSAEAPTVREAVIALLYKHQAVMGSDWLPFCGQTRQVARYR